MIIKFELPFMSATSINISNLLSIHVYLVQTKK